MTSPLTEAIEHLSHTPIHPERSYLAEALVAARAYEAGEDISWCEVHDAQDAGRPDDLLGYCWDGFYLHGDPAVETVRCRMVPRRLCPPIDQKEE